MEIKIIKKRANYEKSMEILQENDLESLTYQEALIHRAELIKAFKGEWKWFYLAGNGIDKSGYHSIDKNGEVREGKGKIENTVYIWKGNNPLSLFVHSDDSASVYGRHFDLDADDGPYVIALVVCGKVSDKTLSKRVLHKHKFVCECGKIKSD